MIKVAFFDAKAYDKPSFEHYGSEHDMQFRFLETKLNEDTLLVVSFSLQLNTTTKQSIPPPP